MWNWKETKEGIEKRQRKELKGDKGRNSKIKTCCKLRKRCFFWRKCICQTYMLISFIFFLRKRIILALLFRIVIVLRLLHCFFSSKKKANKWNIDFESLFFLKQILKVGSCLYHSWKTITNMMLEGKNSTKLNPARYSSRN